MKCSDCKLYKTKECYANPAGDDWDSAESYSCFTLMDSQQAELQTPYVLKKPTKKIAETKCTCTACGNVWFYGKQEILEATGAAMENIGKSLSCLGGCLPAVFIPDKKVVDPNKCPKCGSRAIRKESVTHEV